jgi:hypothetical protein
MDTLSRYPTSTTHQEVVETNELKSVLLGETSYIEFAAFGTPVSTNVGLLRHGQQRLGLLIQCEAVAMETEEVRSMSASTR